MSKEFVFASALITGVSATLSSSIDRVPSAELTLPATSVWVTVIVFSPSARSPF